MPASTNATTASTGQTGSATKTSEQSGDTTPGSQSSNAASGSAPDESRSPDTVDETNGDGMLSRFKQFIGFKNGSIRQDLQIALSDEAIDAGHFSADERVFLSNILGLRDIRVKDVMVPRADVDAAPITTQLADLLHLFRNAGHSRMPVFGDTLDDPRGMVHIKDLMVYISKTAAYKPAPDAKRRKKLPGDLDLRQVDLGIALEETTLIRPVLFVPPSMKASALLAKMQAARIQMALVIDEYGGTDGLVSLEDLVETIVGDIEDEHDEDEKPTIEAEGDATYVADAKAELDEIVDVIGPEFTFGEHSDDADTLGGLVFGLVGRIPVRGELIPAPGPFEIEVMEADPRRIKRLKIHRRRRKTGSKIAVNRSKSADAPAQPSEPPSEQTSEQPPKQTPSAA